jgi:hypothetical protein
LSATISVIRSISGIGILAKGSGRVFDNWIAIAILVVVAVYVLFRVGSGFYGYFFLGLGLVEAFGGGGDRDGESGGED